METLLHNIAEDLDTSISKLDAAKAEMDRGEYEHDAYAFQNARRKLREVVLCLADYEKKIRLLLEQADETTDASVPVDLPVHVR